MYNWIDIKQAARMLGMTPQRLKADVLFGITGYGNVKVDHRGVWYFELQTIEETVAEFREIDRQIAELEAADRKTN